MNSGRLAGFLNCTYVCTQTCVYVSIYVCMYVCMFVCVYICMLVCMYARIYVCAFGRVFFTFGIHDFLRHRSELSECEHSRPKIGSLHMGI
jgi:hypothetical protein